MSKYTCTGKVSDICPNCKNCKGQTRESNGVHVWLTEVECEDPYDGMVKTLQADSNICCSMFELRSEKKEKEPCDKISLLQHELEMEKLRMKIHQLEKEKVAHLKGIERLKEWRKKCITRGDEISKLQNIVTEKDVEIKKLKREIINLGFDRVTIKSIMDKNIKFKQTISDQDVTIKALLITIKEMCKDERMEST